MPSHGTVAGTIAANRTAGRSLLGDGALRRYFNPARERLWAKIAGLEQTLRMLQGAAPEVTEQCWANLEAARTCIDQRWAHAHLAWRFLHRVDEDLLLAIPDVQLHARALDVKATFELSITEQTTRGDWLGSGKDKGRLPEAIEKLSAAKGEGISHMAERYLLREALGTANDVVDRGFWILSMNVLTTGWSAILLGIVMLVLALLWRGALIPGLAELGDAPTRDLLLVLALGAMGAYVGNLLTKRDFLFVQGGPFLRYLLHPLLTKPILGAFAACFVYVVAISGIVFGIGSQSGPTAQGFALAVPAGAVGYVHALLALVSGFAADKVLGDMIGNVLRRLEQKAEKTTKPKEQAKGKAEAAS